MIAEGNPGAENSDCPPAHDPLPDEPHSELGHANRLINVYGHRMRHASSWKNGWLIWDGTRWVRDPDGQVFRWAKIIGRLVMNEALAIDSDPKVRDKAIAVARRGESSSGIKGALTLASSTEQIAITADDLDSDPFLVNCRNGVLDLRTGDLQPHDPELLLTKMAGASYRADANGSYFTKFLERVQPDPEMRRYLARLLGHAMEGRVVSHVLPIFHGAGANGKGTLTTAVLAALGDYGDAADPTLLTARKNDAHPTGTADLRGMRLAVLHEGDAGRHLAEGTVKRLTGGDRLKARRMNEDFWSFEPSHTFLMLTNHKPLVSGTDEGIWRRLRLIPWDVVIPAQERDEELGDRLAQEVEAIFAWLVAGYQSWREIGLADPEQVVAATKDYRAESDALGRFLTERCMSHGTVGSSELFSAWSSWCKSEGHEPGTNKALSTDLEARGYDKQRANSGVRWLRLGLCAEEEL